MQDLEASEAAQFYVDRSGFNDAVFIEPVLNAITFPPIFRE